MGTGTWIIRAAAAVATAVAVLGTPAHAAGASVYVQIAPPAPQYEVVPAPRRHHAWVPGHWQWARTQYVWVPGHFERVRTGHYYAAPRWVQYGNDWGYHPGGWHRGSHGANGHGHARDRDRDHRPGHRPVHARGPDRDRDGIPDRRDRDLDNDGRPNHRDRDRDGDGIRNRHDRAPDNRYRN